MKKHYSRRKKSKFSSNYDKQDTVNLLDGYNRVEILVLFEETSRNEFVSQLYFSHDT